ncbi:MAG: fimbria major subunit, partial [Tannerella sp.]|nr:fimbria major subunit [Tannerella sp.]
GVTAANKILVRRNHVYQVNITKIKGPGIGDPNDIIDPDPKEPEPIEEADTYVTVEIQIMKWHIVAQETEVGLD